jgi:hypothetical protein
VHVIDPLQVELQDERVDDLLGGGGAVRYRPVRRRLPRAWADIGHGISHHFEPWCPEVAVKIQRETASITV